MDETGPARLSTAAATFEQYLAVAINEKYANADPIMRGHLVESWTASAWNVQKLVRAYVDGGVFPIDRLAGLLARAKDVRLQSYFLREVDLGLYNRLYYDPINANLALASSNRLTLIRMSLDQSLIGKSRVLWERVLVLIYYLEFGKDLSSGARGSRKGRFFKDIGEDDLRWGWMSAYQPAIARYDDLFRTPEFHAGSRLRKELEGAPPPDANALLEPLNASMNVVWQNLLVVVAGGSSFSFDLTHMRQDGEHGLDPKWQAWAERAQDQSARKNGEGGPPTVVRK